MIMGLSIDPWEPRPADDGASGDVLIYGGSWPKRQLLARVFATRAETGAELPIAANAKAIEASPRLVEDVEDGLWWLIALRDGDVAGAMDFDADTTQKFAGIIEQLRFGVNLARGGEETAEEIFARVSAAAIANARRREAREAENNRLYPADPAGPEGERASRENANPKTDCADGFERQ